MYHIHDSIEMLHDFIEMLIAFIETVVLFNTVVPCTPAAVKGPNAALATWPGEGRRNVSWGSGRGANE